MVDNRFKKWSEKKYTKKQRLLSFIPEGIFILIIIPIILTEIPRYIDEWLNIPRFSYQPLNIIIAFSLITIGLFFGIWSIYVQFTVGEGTPAPMMPTQKLVTQPPFSYCRNPMSLGTIMFYLGIVTWIGSITSLTILLTFSILLLSYVKFIEERELEQRFGKEYLDYKNKTPFLIPRKKLYIKT